MIQRSKVQEPVLLITDRGYESYNVLTHAQEKGWKFLIRAKDLAAVDSYALTHIRLWNFRSYFIVDSYTKIDKRDKKSATGLSVPDQ